MSFQGLFFGVVQQVFPPDHEQNKSKFQYEYQVIMTGAGYSTIPVRAIVMDRLTHVNNSEDVILDINSRVFLEFPMNDSTVAVIIGGSRSRPEVQPTSTRAVYRNRINETEYEVGDEGELSLRLRDQPDGPIGPELELTKELITIYGDKEAADNGILIDRTNKKITIKTGDWEVTTEKKGTITIGGDANIVVKGKANIEAGDTTLKTKKLTAKIDGNAEITVSGKLTAKAQFIELNGNEGMVLTTATQPACYVTGVPFKGSLKVKAGS